MQITLRKIAQLISSTEETIGRITFNRVAQVSIDKNSVEMTNTIDNTKTKLEEDWTKFEQLAYAAYTMRAIRGGANLTTDIQSLVTEQATVARCIKALKTFASDRSGDELPVFMRKIGRVRETKDTLYGEDYLDFTISTQEFLQKLKLYTQRQVEIADQLLQLNVSTMVELPDETVEVLRKYDIV